MPVYIKAKVSHYPYKQPTVPKPPMAHRLPLIERIKNALKGAR